MRRSIARVSKDPQYFAELMVENKYKVKPPPTVPPHIIKPSYVTERNPTFGIYEGDPVHHNEESIVKMRRAAKVASQTLEATERYIKDSFENKTSITEEDIDRFVFEDIIKQGAYPTPIGFMRFPKSVCVSSNDCLVHGIASERRVKEGDKINIDVTAYIDGVHGDNNLSVIYGEALHSEVRRVVEETREALYAAIGVCGPGTQFRKVGDVIEEYVRRQGLHVCPFFTGHGVGHLLHLPPQVQHVAGAGLDVPMRVGNVFTIEPIVTLRPTTLADLDLWRDDFTVVSRNNPNAQFEHTILIVPHGCEVLTKRTNEIIPNPHRNISNSSLY